MTTGKDRLGYFGPEGTYTHQAARLLANPGSVLVPYDPIDRVYDALVHDTVDRIVVPLESSAEGYVPSSVAQLWRLRDAVRITGHLAIPVTFSLYRKPDDKSPLARLIGHPMALRQINHWLADKDISTCEASSSARGLMMAADGEDGLYALGPPDLGEQFGLTEIETGLEGPTVNRTRFIVLQRHLSPITGTRLCALTHHPLHIGDALKTAGFTPDGLQVATIKTGRGFCDYGYFCEWDLDRPINLQQAIKIVHFCKDSQLAGLLNDMDTP